MAAGPRIQTAGVSGRAEVESSKRRAEPDRRFRIVLRLGSASAAASGTTTAATGTATTGTAVTGASTAGAAATTTGTAASGATRAAYCCAHCRSRPFSRRRSRSHLRYRHITLARAFHHALAVLLAQLLAFLFCLRSAHSRAILFTLLLRHELIGKYLVALLGLEGGAVAILRAILLLGVIPIARTVPILLLRVVPIAREILILRAVLVCGQADDRSGTE